jgi:hypothetical protein
MPQINGMARVNGGTIIKEGKKQFELLGKEHSGHLHNIVCYYFYDGSKKVVISYTDTRHIEVFFYKNKQDLHFYTSRRYSENEVPQNYQSIVDELKDVYNNNF